MKIPYYSPFLPPLETLTEGLKNIYDAHWVSNFGPYAQQFEEEGKKITGAKYVYSLSSADTGLILAIKAVTLQKKLTRPLKIGVPSFTFVSTVNAITWNGHIPVFIDIDENTLCIDPRKIPKHLDVIMPVHCFGNQILLKDLNLSEDVSVIWDCAHSFGMSPMERDIQVYSFSGTKLVTCGEGGLICTNNDELSDFIHLGRNYGFHLDYDSKFNGLNGKISEFNAMVGVKSIPYLLHLIERRQYLASLYKEKLKDVCDFQKISYRSAYKDFAIKLPKVQQIAEYLKTKDIETKRYFFPCHLMKAYNSEFNHLPSTEYIYNNVLCLPFFHALDEDKIDFITEQVKECLKKLS